jgi:ABC-2 type transport system permease protein
VSDDERFARSAHGSSPSRSAGRERLAAVVALAHTELARIVRDRTGLFFILVLPVLVIVVIGSSIGSVAGTATVGVLDLDRTDASARLDRTTSMRPTASTW